MPGLLGIIRNHEDLNEFDIDYLSLAPFNCQKKDYKNLRFERFTNQKFLDDKVFEEDDDLLIGIEGIIFNYADLRAKYNADTNFTLIKQMYEASEDSFFNDFRGEFSGFVYNKKKNTVHVFTNHTSSKNIYYYFDADVFIFASEVKVITQTLKKLGKNCSLNETGAYFLLTYGFMLQDQTLVKDIKKLLHGHYIKIELKRESDDEITFSHQISPYFRFTNTNITNESQSEIIERIDEKFKQSVMLEYKKDVEYGYRHIATLSGGLDSRMSVLMADKLGFKDITTMTFSESDYWDEKIARQIAREHGFEYLFMSLDHGNYLKDIDSAVIANDGNVFYAGAAHHLRMTSFVNHKDFGLQHTGMIGDAVIGSFIDKDPTRQINVRDGAYSSKYLGKIQSEFNQIAENYDNLEMYLFYNRAFNGAFNGYWMTQQFTEFSSAFLDVDLLSYTLTIPPKMKFKERIYLDWIRAKHPDIGKYKWEQAMTSINKWHTYFRALSYSKRVVRALKRRLHLSRLYSMNPFEAWYRSNPSLREFLSRKFNQDISNLDKNPEIKNDCIAQFNEGNTKQKTQVLTLLRAMDILLLA